MTSKGDHSDLGKIEVSAGGGDEYRYQSLSGPDDAIRLLVLEPDKDVMAQVRCSLIQTSLRECDNDMVDHYTALSYVWGDAKIRTPALVDGKPLDITLNLDSALRYMRDPKRKRYIWADAICINQKDTEEKNKQVAQMAEVYKFATQTVIFLGEPTEETDKIMIALCSDQSSASADLPYESLLSRPWFSRVWIYQELVLSPDPWIQCGQHKIRWEKLYALTKERTATKKSLRSWDSFLHMTKGRNRWRQMQTSAESPTPAARILLDTLIARRGMGVFDPRDMLFAHLGVADVQSGDEETKKLLKVDYNKPVEQVYTDLAHYLCVASLPVDLFRVLSYVDESYWQKREKHIPSWVPDWTVKDLETDRCLREVVNECFVPRELFRPDDYSHLPSLWLDSAIFITPGQYVGTIEHLSHIIERPQIKVQDNGPAHPRNMSEPPRSISRDWVEKLLAKLAKMGPRMTSFWDTKSQLWRRESEVMETNEWEYYKREFESHRAHPTEAVGKNTKWEVWAGITELRRNILYHAMAEEEQDEACPRFIYGRRIASMKAPNGDMFCALVPPVAKMHDDIVWMHGDFTIPYIVRHQSVDRPERSRIKAQIRSNCSQVERVSAPDGSDAVCSEHDFESVDDFEFIEHVEFVGESLIDWGTWEKGYPSQDDHSLWKTFDPRRSVSSGYFVLH